MNLDYASSTSLSSGMSFDPSLDEDLSLLDCLSTYYGFDLDDTSASSDLNYAILSYSPGSFLYGLTTSNFFSSTFDYYLQSISLSSVMNMSLPTISYC